MVNVPNPESVRLSAIANLRELGSDEEADLLSRCKLEIGDTAQQYSGCTSLGLNITLRCRAVDLAKFEDDWDVALPSAAHMAIQRAIQAVLPAQLNVHDLSARSLLVDRDEFEKTELERLIEAQINLMIAVATGGPEYSQKMRSTGSAGESFATNCNLSENAIRTLLQTSGDGTLVGAAAICRAIKIVEST